MLWALVFNNRSGNTVVSVGFTSSLPLVIKAKLNILLEIYYIRKSFRTSSSIE